MVAHDREDRKKRKAKMELSAEEAEALSVHPMTLQWGAEIAADFTGTSETKERERERERERRE